MKIKKLDLLPVWTDDSAYPSHVKDWCMFQWAWAFLRRNTEYRDDYGHFAALLSYYPDTHTKTSKWSGRSASMDDDMSLRYCVPASLPNETYRQYLTRLDKKFEVETSLEEHLMGKWGIGNLPAPSDDLGYKILFPLDEVFPKILHLDAPYIGGYIPLTPAPDESEQVTLRFDLRFSINTQIKKAKEILKEEEGRKSCLGDLEKVRAATPKKTELLKYLRAFDARAVDAKYIEIGAKLYPEKNKENSQDAMKQSAKRAFDIGKSLVDGGYKTLLKFW